MKVGAYSLEDNVHCAALSMLVAALGEGALDDLLAVMDNDSRHVRAAALNLADDIPGGAATARWVDRMRNVRPEVRAEILTMLARRGDSLALPTVVAALNDKDKDVRLAAISAIPQLAGADAVPLLLSMMETDLVDEITATQDVLMRMGDDDAIRSMVTALPHASSTGRVAIIEMLAARRAQQYVNVVFTLAKQDDPTVRSAAIAALGPLADEEDLPRVVAFLRNAATDPERTAAQNSVAAVARRSVNPGQCIDQILSAFATATETDRSYLMPVLAAVGGPKALQTVLNGTRSDNEDLQDAAVRALAEWHDVSAVEELLAIARTSANLIHQVLALRGYIRLTGTADLSAEQKFQMYKDAMAAATQPNEKMLVLAGLGADVKTVDSLEFVSTYLNDETLRPEAVMAVIAIVRPGNGRAEGLQGDRVAVVLEKVLAVCENEELREEVRHYLSTMPRDEETNQPEDGFVLLFNGEDLTGWVGDTDGYVVENGAIVCKPGGNLYTEKQYSDFMLRFDFRLTPGANNGLGIRAPLEGDSAYVGMEIQILDNTADVYKDLKPYQYHGSIYGVVPAVRGYLKPVGDWNYEEVVARGSRITVNLNGTTIVDADVHEAGTPTTMDGRPHPGLERTTGHIGFLGHGSHVEFRNIRIKKLDEYRSRE